MTNPISPQIRAGRVISSGSAAVLDIVSGDYPDQKFEIFAETNVVSDLIIEGSIDRVTYRETFRVAAVSGSYQNIFDNCYKFVRIRFENSGNQTIEIAFGGT